MRLSLVRLRLVRLRPMRSGEGGNLSKHMLQQRLRPVREPLLPPLLFKLPGMLRA